MINLIIIMNLIKKWVFGYKNIFLRLRDVNDSWRRLWCLINSLNGLTYSHRLHIGTIILLIILIVGVHIAKVCIKFRLIKTETAKFFFLIILYFAFIKCK